jgi:hypothetical protein
LDLFPKSKKEKKREDAEFKHAKGELSEEIYRERQMLRGNRVIRRDQRKGGWDYTVQRTNMFGQPVGPEYHHEVKSNSWDRETKRQRLQRAKDKNYRRIDINIDSIPGSNILVEGKVLQKRYKKMKWF